MGFEPAFGLVTSSSVRILRSTECAARRILRWRYRLLRTGFARAANSGEAIDAYNAVLTAERQRCVVALLLSKPLNPMVERIEHFDPATEIDCQSTAVRKICVPHRVLRARR